MIEGASVNVMDFGATGDGTTDDTAAIQAAIDSLDANGAIFIPEGIFNISSTLLVTINVNFTGVLFYGVGIASKIQWVGTADGSPMLRYVAGVAGKAWYGMQQVRDCWFNGLSGGGIDGIHMGDPSLASTGGVGNVTISNVRISSIDSGIKLNSESDEVTIEKCHIRVYYAYGIYNLLGGSGVRIINNHIQDPLVAGTIGIYSGLTAITISNNIIQGGSAQMNGILIEGARGFQVTTNYSEATTYATNYFIKIINSKAGIIHSNEIGAYIGADLIHIDATSKGINIGPNSHSQSGGVITSLARIETGATHVNIYGKQITSGSIVAITGYENCDFVTDHISYDRTNRLQIFGERVLANNKAIGSIYTYNNLDTANPYTILTFTSGASGESYLLYLNAVIYNTEITALVNIAYNNTVTITTLTKTGTDIDLTSSGLNVIVSTATAGVKTTTVSAIRIR